jgi:C_GCAxxG_C_C family probable redox protein
MTQGEMMDTKDMEVRDQVATHAANLFGNGYHCAEAIVDAVLSASKRNAREVVAQATAFGGGMGKTQAEACGALSGGLIVIGYLHGRRNPGQDWDLPAELGAKLRTRFLESHGTTLCSALRDRFGEEQQMTECREIVRNITYELLMILPPMEDLKASDHQRFA